MINAKDNDNLNGVYKDNSEIECSGHLIISGALGRHCKIQAKSVTITGVIGDGVEITAKTITITQSGRVGHCVIHGNVELWGKIGSCTVDGSLTKHDDARFVSTPVVIHGNYTSTTKVGLFKVASSIDSVGTATSSKTSSCSVFPRNS